MIVVLGVTPLLRKGDLRRNLVLVASVDARTVRVTDRRIRRGIIVDGPGADRCRRRGLVGAVLVNTRIWASTDRRVGSLA